MAETGKTVNEAGASAASAAARGADPAGMADRQKAEARMNAGLEMLTNLGRLALAGASLGGKAALVGLRGTVPMLELYSGTTRKAEQDRDGDGGGLENLGFSRGEAGVIRKAFTKGILESLEISSITHPVYDGAPVYHAYNADGVMQPPHMVHFLSLGAAGSAIWRRWEASRDPPKPEPVPVVTIPAAQTVAFVATAPGEYEYIAAPQTASDIRRYAMRQRSLNPPRLAMLAHSGDPGSIRPVGPRMISEPNPLSGTRAWSKASPNRGRTTALQVGTTFPPSRRQGCGCGGIPADGCGCGCGGTSSCDCGCGGQEARAFPPARRDDDGGCVSIFSISCETRWRIRDCLKVSFCDFLRCVGDELCEREEGDEIDLRECLEDFLCSFLTCLPDAICPPPQPCKPCCPPRLIESCHCNFAVGE
ncbi:hypothetical protein SAMN06265378_106192 [Paracoccus sediminis]|uniref:Uncharacterized protein n=1 Tax=Paracoccus sediminis TaxID=1214787 RepID=A0A238WXY1_9RHOB|nr:hypothetical protein SAMN06265378_106192 [Paracoccus sediminis]